MDFGVSSRALRALGCVSEEWSGTSNFREPICPCELALRFIGWAKVRPEEVRANKWLFPAEIATNLSQMKAVQQT